jgi:hypothetical protein
MKTIELYINKKVDSFGTKTVIFMAKEGGIYIASRDEGSHHELEIGEKVHDAGKWDNPDCTLKQTKTAL